MKLLLLNMLLGAGASTWLTAGCNLVQKPEDLWIPVLLWMGFVLALTLAFFLFALVLTSFVNKKKEVKKPNRFFVSLFDWGNDFLMVLFGIRVKVEGKEKIRKGQRYLWIGNHRSNFDPMVVAYAFPEKLAFISKPGNLRLPIAGGAIHKCGYLPIDRENDRAALKTIIKAAKMMKENDMSFGVFPEGTRSKDGTLLPFKAGCLKVAALSDSPIAVLSICGTEKIMKNFPWRMTTVTVRVIDVVDAQTVKNTPTVFLCEQLKGKIAAELEEEALKQENAQAA